MDKLYYYETLKECEKEVISKCIDLDIVYGANANLFECFCRTVRSIMICIMIFLLVLSIIHQSSPLATIAFILFGIYIFGKVIMSWVKFNFNRSCELNKVNLVDEMLNKCKEYNEAKWEDWEKKQVLKRFAELAGLDIDWDKAK